MNERTFVNYERLDASLARRLASLKYTTPELVFERIEIDDTCQVLVIGGDGEGAYEWVIVKDGKVESHSDAGYGMPHAALRDGLITYWPPAELRGEQASYRIGYVDGATGKPPQVELTEPEKALCTLAKRARRPG